ncbi:MAG: hypothetical protein QXU32_00845 [Nitrososphaerales archaeon]
MGLGPYTKTIVQDNVTRILATHHNTQENQIEALTDYALAINNMVADSVNFGTVAAGVATERPVFVAPADCRVYGVILVNSDNVPANSVNYTKLELVNKGSTGSGSIVIATFDGSNTSFTAFDAVSLSMTAVDLSANDVLTIRKSDTGTGANVTNLLVKILYRPIP